VPVAREVRHERFAVSGAGWTVEVDCSAIDTGWRCSATVDDGRGSSRHEVTVGAEDALSLATASTTDGVERLVFETVDFLLERESRDSILRTFDITVVGRYFPEYEREIRSRLAP
jgi:hypothetical protein